MKIKSEVIECDMKRKSKKAYAKEIFMLIFMLTAMILAQGCSNDNAKHVEALEGYT